MKSSSNRFVKALALLSLVSVFAGSLTACDIPQINRPGNECVLDC